MTPDPVGDLVRRINASDATKAVVYVAGGGTAAFPELLARGGGSATLLAGRIPYDPADFRSILGHDPGRLVDARAARGLAMAAYRHALAIRGDLAPGQVFGLGSTSKLSRGDGEREGRAHEIHAAMHGPGRTDLWSVTLPVGADREWEERINTLHLLNILARGKGATGTLPLQHDGRSVPDDSIKYLSSGYPECRHAQLPKLYTGLSRWVAYDLPVDEIQVGDAATGEPPRMLLPGSFRPLHDGHVAMAEVASELTGLPCAFEISIVHPDKPPLDYFAIESRLKGFRGRGGRLYLTDAPTYLDKARLFPGCTFVVGHDTALRIVDARYYGGATGRDAVLAELEALGTRFVVFGRVDSSGRFRDFSATEFEHPVAGFLDRVARPVPERLFRFDLSSTQVRERAGEDFA